MGHYTHPRQLACLCASNSSHGYYLKVVFTSLITSDCAATTCVGLVLIVEVNFHVPHFSSQANCIFNYELSFALAVCYELQVINYISVSRLISYESKTHSNHLFIGDISSSGTRAVVRHF